MGVPGYFKTIIKENPDLLYFSENEDNDYLFMDYNNLIHTAYQEYLKKMENKLSNKSLYDIEKEIIQHIVKKTIDIVNNIVKPKKLFYIAMDGTPPRAKMEQQRLRRFKSVLEKGIEKELKAKYNLDNTEYFDSNNISPGTLFMQRLSKELEKNITAKKFKVPSVILSDSSVVGEGEHKIIPYIKSNINNSSKICIYGDDADLIFLSMTILNIEHNIKIMKTQSLEDTKFEKKKLAYLNVSKLANIFYSRIGLPNVNKIRLLYDYIFMMILFGDDFVKKSPCFSIRIHHDLFVNTYKHLFTKNQKHLILIKNKKYCVNKKFLVDFLQKLSNLEEKFLRTMQTNLKKNCDKPYINSKDLEGYELETSIYKNSLFCQKENMFYKDYNEEFNKIDYSQDKHIWKKEYYTYFFDLNMKYYNQKRSEICAAYMKSIKFTFEYYLKGIPPSWNFYYPYRVAPFISDVLTNLKSYKFNMNSFEFTQGVPYTPIQQLLIIMPSQMKHKVPKECSKIMTNKKFNKYYQKTFKLDALAGLKFIYSEPLLNELDEQIILEELKKNYDKLSNADKKRDELTEVKEFNLGD